MLSVATALLLFCLQADPQNQADLDSAQIAKARLELAAAEKEYGLLDGYTSAAQVELGALLVNRGEFTEAQTLFTAALDAYQKTLGENHEYVIIVWRHLIKLHQTTGNVAEKQSALEHLLSVQEQLFGVEQPQVATTLNSLGFLLQSQGKFESALPFYKRALAIRQKVFDPGHVDIALSANNLGFLLGDMQRFEEALIYSKLAAADVDSWMASNPEGARGHVLNLGFAHLQLGQTKQAIPHFRKTVAILETMLDENTPAFIQELTYLGETLQGFGGDEFSIELFTRAVEIGKRIYGSDNINIAPLLNSLGNACNELEKYDLAEASLKDALAINIQHYGQNHLEVAATLGNLALVYEDQREFQLARPLLERSLEITEELSDDNSDAASIGRINLAMVLKEQGLNLEAKALLERALHDLERILSADDPLLSVAMANLANLYYSLNDWQLALPLFRKAAALCVKLRGNYHPETWAIRFNLINCCLRAKEYGEAKELLDSFEADYPGEPRLLMIRGLLLWRTGDMEVAMDHMREATQEMRQLYGPNHRRTANASLVFAKMLMEHGALAEAEGELASNLDYSFNWLETQLPSMSEAGRLRLLNVSADPNSYLRCVAGNENGRQTDAYARCLRWKGMATRLQAASLAMRGALQEPAAIRLQSEVENLSKELSQLILLPRAFQAQGHGANIDHLRRQRLKLERELNAKLGLAEHLRSSDFSQIQGAMPEDSVLLDFYVGAKVFAWITKPGGQPILIPLGSAADLRVSMNAFLEAAAVRGGKLLKPTAVDPATEFYRKFWTPLVDVVGNAQTVFVSPDGFLGELPFGIVTDTASQYLLEKHRFVYLSDATQIVRTEAADSDLEGALLSVGGVNYFRRDQAPEATSGAALSTRSRVGSNWTSLPATREELQAIRDLHEYVLKWQSPILQLEGKAATEEAVRAALPGHRYVHIATHGYFEPDHLPSLLMDAEEKQADDFLDQQIQAAGTLPGLLSGLVFAGVNAEPDFSRDDGYLSAEEILHLDLASCDLVVLSACETALGSVRAGEGLMSLRRAFEVAGADTVISSLWKVDDLATAVLIKDFYTNLWQKNLPRAEALHQAKLQMLRRNRAEEGEAKPGTWGAFVLSGGWR
jgi:CHAT domain-containing protein/tetratricopeptide (TPR) repeat protein